MPKIGTGLKALAQLRDNGRPMTQEEIGGILGEPGTRIFNSLTHYMKDQFVIKDKDSDAFSLTERGLKFLEAEESKGTVTESDGGGGGGGGGDGDGDGDDDRDRGDKRKPATTPPGIPEGSVPTQADVFEQIGNDMRIGKRGGTSLSSVMAVLNRAANFEDPEDIYKWLVDLGVSGPARKMWLEMYIRAALPEKVISPEFLGRIRQDAAKEERGDGASSVAAKGAAMYNVINGEIFADPDGEFTFGRAIQYAAHQKGATSGQAETLASALVKSNSETVNTIIPLLVSGGKGDESPLLARLLDQKDRADKAEGRVEIEVLRSDIRELAQAIGGNQGGNPELTELRNQLTNLQTQLTDSKFAALMQENKQTTAALVGELNHMKETIQSIATGQHAQGRYDIMGIGLKEGLKELGSGRQAIIELASKLLDAGGPPAVAQTRRRSDTESRALAAGAKGAAAVQDKTGQMEQELWNVE